MCVSIKCCRIDEDWELQRALAESLKTSPLAGRVGGVGEFSREAGPPSTSTACVTTTGPALSAEDAQVAEALRLSMEDPISPWVPGRADGGAAAGGGRGQTDGCKSDSMASIDHNGFSLCIQGKGLSRGGGRTPVCTPTMLFGVKERSQEVICLGGCGGDLCVPGVELSWGVEKDTCVYLEVITSRGLIPLS